MPPDPAKMWRTEEKAVDGKGSATPQPAPSTAADARDPATLIAALQEHIAALNAHLIQVKGELGAIRLKAIMAQEFLAHSPSEGANGVRQVIEAVSALQINILDGKGGATLSNKALPGLDGGIAAAERVAALAAALASAVVREGGAAGVQAAEEGGVDGSRAAEFLAIASL